MKIAKPYWVLSFGTFLCFGAFVHAAAEVTATSEPAPGTPTVFENRYGPLGVFDSRSQYGKGVFPEPFIIDDSDLEVNEFRQDWSYQQAPGSITNSFTTELEKGFGMLTVELEVHFDYDTTRQFDTNLNRSVHTRSVGFDNVDIGARHPVFQYVSPDEFFDTTFGVGFEAGIPTNSILSKNTELVPKVFNDTRLGDHFTFQTIIGYSYLLGSKPDGGSKTLEYGALFGWTFPHSELPIPGVDQFIPIFEVAGELPTNGDDRGTNSLTGNAAFRLNLKAIGRIQPRLGVGYVFPMDRGARADLRSGIYTSLVFEF